MNPESEEENACPPMTTFQRIISTPSRIIAPLKKIMVRRAASGTRRRKSWRDPSINNGSSVPMPTCPMFSV